MQHTTGILRKLVRPIAHHIMGTVTHVTTREPLVALTFDDGPDPKYTPRLLEVLERHGARATFFMIGEAAQKYPDIVKSVAEHAHVIGNHSWNHTSFPLISARERREQIRACAQAIAPYGMPLFRPPYGHQDVASRLDALWLGYQVITWNVTTDDWLGSDAKTIADQLESRVQPGAVVVLHDRLFDALEERYFDRDETVEAVHIFLRRLCGRFRFVTVPDLLRHGKPERAVWTKQANIEFLNGLKTMEGAGRQYEKNERCDPRPCLNRFGS